MLNEDIELKSSDIDSTSTEEIINVGNNSERKTIKEKEDIKLLYGNNINIRETKKIGNISNKELPSINHKKSYERYKFASIFYKS